MVGSSNSVIFFDITIRIVNVIGTVIYFWHLGIHSSLIFNTAHQSDLSPINICVHCTTIITN